MINIKLNNVCKTYSIYEKERKKMSIFQTRVEKNIKAVNNLSLEINQGEVVGLIGKNGSGKSTIIKMLTGILPPDSGGIEVFGRVPYLFREENSKKIGVVFGQKTQLWWELPAKDTFLLHKRIYKIDDKIFGKNMQQFAEVLEYGDFINQSSRQLSLGQRVRLDIALALMHNPEILFLDEPSIGLDILVKKKIRIFLKQICKERNITLILTSHDMKDIEEICDRVVIIDNGRLLIDGSIEEIKLKFGKNSILEVLFEDDIESIELQDVVIRKIASGSFELRYDEQKISTKKVITLLLDKGKIKHIGFKAEQLEEIVTQIYQRTNI